MALPEGKGQQSLVAFFGEKRTKYPEFWQFIQILQREIIATVGADAFVPYSEQRVHGTIIGLEGDRIGDVVLNRNAYQKLGQLQPMDLQSAIDFLLSPNDLLPIDITFGGYQKDRHYAFSSQNSHPYFRSFSIQGRIAVAMGWPHSNDSHNSSLDNLRRSFNQFNIIHKYHSSDCAYDNDFFFVLGQLTKKLNPNEIQACETKIRDTLSRQKITLTSVGTDAFNVIPYFENDTTFLNVKPLTLEEAKERVDELRRFYPEIR